MNRSSTSSRTGESRASEQTRDSKQRPDSEQTLASEPQRVLEQSGTLAGSDNTLRPLLVRASAGTGKTYQLTARLLRVLLQGAAPESILATTFTRKAAGEILDRLLLTLAQAADPDDEVALKGLRSQVGIPTLPRSVCLQLLDKLLRNIHRLRICTLDSLFAQLARSFPFELGLPPAWRLTDEIEELWLRERAVDAVVATLDPSEMTAMLSMLGKGEVKRSVARELLQVVNAAYTAQRQCGPEVWKKLRPPRQPESAALTDVAGQLRQAEPRQKRHRTKLQQLAERIELRDFDSLVDDTLLGNIARARQQGSEVLYFRAPFPEQTNEPFDVLYQAVRSHVLSLLRAQNEATGTVLAAYDHQIQSLKRAARALGFEDVAIRLADQFSKLDAQAVSRRMDGAIDHVLLDEFQDTSPAQWQVLLPLITRVTDVPAEEASEAASGKQAPRSFFCVGDTKQAIYGWRGGVAEIFDAVTDQVEGVTPIQQDTSYRSSPVVIEAINRTFPNLIRHPLVADSGPHDPLEKASWEAAAVGRFARQFPRHQAHKTDLAGHVRMLTSARPAATDTESLRRACFEQATAIATQINRRAPKASVGLLTRTNRGVAQLIYLLERSGVEVSQEGGNPLTDSAAVELVLSALMMAEHPGDGRWQFHVRNSPLGAHSQIGSAAEMQPHGIRRLVEDRGLTEAIEWLGGKLAPHCDERETLRLKQLIHLALQYERSPSPRLRDFVRLVREKRVERPQAAPVRVMTVHQSKGLEFDAVVLAELDGPLTRPSGNCVCDVRALGEPPRGITRYVGQKSWHYLPTHWQRAFGQQAEAAMTEALCLLYVAMTRARQSLQMVVPPARKPEFANRTPAALIYHALECDADPTRGEQTLFEAGDPEWMVGTHDQTGDDPPEILRKQIRFQPLPSVPQRHSTTSSHDRQGDSPT